MGLEIERKFLVKGEFIPQSKYSFEIVQGYLSITPENTVRVRTVKGKLSKGRYLTIKGESSENGLTRYEWEKELSYNDTKDLLNLCGDKKIEKTRYIVTVGDHDYEVDVFHGKNDGLVVAEIELKSEDDVFIKPDWLGEEVTGDIKYYNSSLIENPFKNW